MRLLEDHVRKRRVHLHARRSSRRKQPGLEHGVERLVLLQLRQLHKVRGGGGNVPLRDLLDGADRHGGSQLVGQRAKNFVVGVYEELRIARPGAKSAKGCGAARALHAQRSCIPHGQLQVEGIGPVALHIEERNAIQFRGNRKHRRQGNFPKHLNVIRVDVAESRQRHAVRHAQRIHANAVDQNHVAHCLEKRRPREEIGPGQLQRHQRAIHAMLSL